MNNNFNDHSTIISAAALLADAIEHYGLDYHAIAREAGIDPDHGYSPNDRLPVSKLQKLWHLAVSHTGDLCFGLTYASFIQPAALHGLGLAWLSSDTLKDGLNRLVRYQRVVSTALNIQLEEHHETYNLIFHTNAFGGQPAIASIDAGVAAFFSMCKLTAGPDIQPTHVMFEHEKPECAKRFNEFFGIEVEFSADDNRVIFDKETLEKPLSTAHPELARVNDEMVIEYLRHFDKEVISTQVRAQIIEQLPGGIPHQDMIAQSLNLSLRNLQRKLQAEGTSYKELMDETRKELAIQYLKGSDRQIIEIGFLLGFSETSNFSRAFRRWVGVSPQQYRNTHH